MPAGFATQCPNGFEFFIPISPWLTALWVAVYALLAEAALLELVVFAARLRRNVTRGAAESLLLVVGCAAVALAVAWWMTNRDIQASCFTLPVAPHFNATYLAQVDHLYTHMLTQARVSFGIAAVLIILATTLTALTMVRSWRASMRKRQAFTVAR